MEECRASTGLTGMAHFSSTGRGFPAGDMETRKAFVWSHTVPWQREARLGPTGSVSITPTCTCPTWPGVCSWRTLLAVPRKKEASQAWPGEGGGLASAPRLPP